MAIPLVRVIGMFYLKIRQMELKATQPNPDADTARELLAELKRLQRQLAEVQERLTTVETRQLDANW